MKYSPAALGVGGTAIPQGNVASPYRWVVLTGYMAAGIASQLVWITFAPILDVTAQHYGVTQSAVGMLAAVFPLVYLVASLPTGYFIDRYGFRSALLMGTSLLAVFSALRPLAWSFAALLAFQTLAGLGQPFIMNSISKLVRAWFPEEEAGLATGLGTLSLMVGIIAGLAATPKLASALGLGGALWVYAAYTIATLALVAAVCREPPSSGGPREAVSPREILAVLRHRNLQLLSALFLLGVGSYTAFTTWVEPLVSSLSVSRASAGLVGSALTIGGITGSIIVPGLADRYRTRRRPMICCLAAASLVWLLAYEARGSLAVAAALFMAGFFFVSLAPLALDLSAASVGEAMAGAANAVLWEFSQIGSLALIWAFERASSMAGWAALYPAMAALTLVMLLLALPLGEH